MITSGKGNNTPYSDKLNTIKFSNCIRKNKLYKITALANKLVASDGENVQKAVFDFKSNKFGEITTHIERRNQVAMSSSNGEVIGIYKDLVIIETLGEKKIINILTKSEYLAAWNKDLSNTYNPLETPWALGITA